MLMIDEHDDQEFTARCTTVKRNNLNVVQGIREWESQSRTKITIDL